VEEQVAAVMPLLVAQVVLVAAQDLIVGMQAGLAQAVKEIPAEPVPMMQVPVMLVVVVEVMEVPVVLLLLSMWLVMVDRAEVLA
jgi:hypothetical protein